MVNVQVRKIMGAYAAYNIRYDERNNNFAANSLWIIMRMWSVLFNGSYQEGR
jgi:hypothetical protein